MHPTLQIANLKNLCAERVEESLVLEFKSCNEIRVGSEFFDHTKGTMSTRTKDDVVNELSRDVSAFLNSAGGTLLYGIREKDSRAHELDYSNSFKVGENITPEVIVQWIRAYVQPSPSVNAYKIFEDSGDPSSSWYIGIEIPQGQQAYMARDHRFYKRVGNIVQPMQQYEVVDVMNRTSSASLLLQVHVSESVNARREDWSRIGLKIAITSDNFIASEYGALKMTLAWPMMFASPVEDVWRNARHEAKTGMPLLGYDDIPRAESLLIRWGANTGNVIFPGYWHDFYGNSVPIELPATYSLANPTYLVQVELFNINSQSRKMLYALKQISNTRDFELIEVTPEYYDQAVHEYWETFHRAREQFKL